MFIKNKLDLNKNILIICKKWLSNRGKLTSIERFCSILDDSFNDNYSKEYKIKHSIIKFIIKHSNSNLTHQGTAYNSKSINLELYGLVNSFNTKAKIIFYPYADYDYNYLGHFKFFLRKKIVLWTFFSVDELKSRFKNLSHFEKADLILVAGMEQYNFLITEISKPLIRYFPIGVDTQFFKPSATYTKYQIIFSGANRRDFATAVAAFDIVFETFNDLKVVFVGCNSHRNNIPNRPYIEICGQLEDEEMLKIYQNSHLQVLTLLDGGSSNSLLEGYACGIPIICTEIENISDYLVEDEELKIKINDFLDLSNKIKEIFNNNDLRERLSLKCIEKAKNYDWYSIKENFLKELEKL